MHSLLEECPTPLLRIGHSQHLHRAISFQVQPSPSLIIADILDSSHGPRTLPWLVDPERYTSRSSNTQYPESSVVAMTESPEPPTPVYTAMARANQQRLARIALEPLGNVGNNALPLTNADQPRRGSFLEARFSFPTRQDWLDFRVLP
jgi:hypothetical protein